MNTIIFGKDSNLTFSLKKKLKKSLYIISSRDFLKNPNKYDSYFKNNFKLIINGFSPSYVFKNINFNEKFVNQSINSITQLLDRLDKKKLRKLFSAVLHL